MKTSIEYRVPLRKLLSLIMALALIVCGRPCRDPDSGLGHLGQRHEFGHCCDLYR